MKKFNINDYFSTALILALLVILLYLSGILSRFDHLIYDVGQKIYAQSAPTDIVIVAIDESSLKQLGRWPWSRKLHADLISRLKADGAAAIGLDIVFAEPDQSDKNADQNLAQAIAEAGNVVLPVLIENTQLRGQTVETLPMPEFATKAADIGRVHAALDEDGIARSVYLYEGLGAPVWQLFSQAILNVAEHKPSKNHHYTTNKVDEKSIPLLTRQDQRRINFLGPTGQFSTISYAQVLNNQFEKGFFKNKMVLVGATASGMGDFLSTPVSGLSQPMPGVELHANALQSIRQNKLISTVNNIASMAILLIIALLPLLWLPKLPALASLLATLMYFVFVSFVAMLLLKVLSIWVPPSAALLPILLAYPIWSWRKLEQARQYLDYELNYLKQNLITLPAANNSDSFDRFHAQLEQVRSASQQLRFLQNDRKELLAFISHDLRAPIANALLILEENKVVQPRLEASLTQAHNLAEDFLQASRAEMIDSAKFKEIDVASLAHQAVDDAFEAAKKKNIMLKRDIVDDQVWVNGNFGLLQRAVLNLILNAVKFSPENAPVTIKLAFENRQAVLSVTNSGKGIPIDEQLFLFKRFSRVSSGENADGSGLGLYFVQTVAEKHHGFVAVESDVDKDTCFTFRLPALN